MLVASKAIVFSGTYFIYLRISTCDRLRHFLTIQVAIHTLHILGIGDPLPLQLLLATRLAYYLLMPHL